MNQQPDCLSIEALRELVKSIMKEGIVDPIVIPKRRDTFELIDGQIRIRFQETNRCLTVISSKKCPRN